MLKAAQVRKEAPMPWSDAQNWERGCTGGSDQGLGFSYGGVVLGLRVPESSAQD